MANQVKSGKYSGCLIALRGRKSNIFLSLVKKVPITQETVEYYQVVTEEVRKSAASGAARGLVGGALLGPVGMLAGGMSAKSKGTYRVVIQWRTGEKSLLELDQPNYNALVESCLGCEYRGETSRTSQASSELKIGVADELLKLKNLLENGTITEEEFQRQKTALLGVSQMSASISPPQEFSTEKPKSAKKRGIVIALIVVVAFIGISAVFSQNPEESSLDNNSIPASSEEKYAIIDEKQVDNSKIVQNGLDQVIEDAGLILSGSEVSWIGYNNFKDTFSIEEFEDTALGGYYSYNATLINGVVVSGRIRAYWDENDEPVTIDLKVLDPQNTYYLIDYNEDELNKSWDIYQEKVYGESI